MKKILFLLTVVLLSQVCFSGAYAQENQKPYFTTATYSINTNTPEIGTNFTFTAAASDSEGDIIKLKFWVCKLDGTICNNAMNGASETWTSGNQFSWTAAQGGDYELHVIAIDGHHADTSNPFGDAEYVLKFMVYGAPTCTSPNVLYNNQCVDPIPACKNPIANSVSCIDKIDNGQYIEHYSFNCLSGYTKTSNGCVSSSNTTSSGTTTTQNQKPSITSVTYAIDTNVPQIGTKFTFTAGGQDPENDNYKMKFWVCKLDGTICNNAMNGSAEEWTYGNQFVWKAPDGGKYQLHVIIIDGHHAGADSAFGDGQYTLPLEVYGNPTTANPSTTSPVTTSSSNNTANTTSSTASGAATAHTPSIPKAGYEDDVLTAFDSNPFSDTNITSDSGKAAAELYRRGVIGGYADGEFKGSRSVNRAEAAKFLLLARYGSVDDLSNSGKFWDVLDGQWYTKFVVKAANLGIINGYGDGSFKPASTVSVAEFLKMLTKTFSLQENLSYSYTDVQSTDWFAPYAGIAQKYNLFPNHQTKLMPQTLLARDEVALAIYQYLKNR